MILCAALRVVRFVSLEIDSMAPTYADVDR
jgi:hypothetical protein